MNPITLAQQIEERYRRYLKTTFYFKDPVLRASFEEALQLSGFILTKLDGDALYFTIKRHCIFS